MSEYRSKVRRRPALPFAALRLAVPAVAALGAAFPARAEPPVPAAGSAAPAAQEAPDFEPGLWKVVVAIHVWGPITKHQTAKRCWLRPDLHLSKQSKTQKCKMLDERRHGNTYVMNVTCHADGHVGRMHLSRTYAGNTATESGTMKMGSITAHMTGHATRLGRCPAKQGG